MLDLSRNELLSRLNNLDKEAYFLYKSSKRFKMIIVGSSSLILSELISRKTIDIDSIYVSNELLPLLEKYDFNTRAETYINNFPYNFEDRTVLFLAGQQIDYFVPSLEDIVISKLCAARLEDKNDVMSEGVLKKINWDLLEFLATDDGELKSSILNERNYMDFLYEYNEFVRRCKPCES